MTEFDYATPKLNQALVAIREEITNPPMDSINPHFKSKFASLQAVIEAIVPTAAKHGVMVAQDIQEAEGGMRCYTHIIHESGEEKRFGPIYVPCTTSNAQGYASASTYARRYHLQGVFCVVGDKDDDGNAASESAFGSVGERSKVRNKLLKALQEGDDAEVAHIRECMDNDQKAELAMYLNKPQKDQIREALDRHQTDQSIEQ